MKLFRLWGLWVFILMGCLPALLRGSSKSVEAGEQNKLVILKQKDHYTFYVNGEVVGQIVNSNYPYGQVGVGIELENAGDDAVFEFDNFIIWSPTK